MSRRDWFTVSVVSAVLEIRALNEGQAEALYDAWHDSGVCPIHEVSLWDGECDCVGDYLEQAGHIVEHQGYADDLGAVPVIGPSASYLAGELRLVGSRWVDPAGSYGYRARIGGAWVCYTCGHSCDCGEDPGQCSECGTFHGYGSPCGHGFEG